MVCNAGAAFNATQWQDGTGAVMTRREQQKLAELRERIERERARQHAGEQRGRAGDTQAAAHHLVLRLLADMGVALLAGGLLGYGIDHYFGTRPWGLLGGALLGLAAGVRNVLHTADSVNRSRKPR